MLTVVTCRWGDKYSNEHVNRLFNQLIRHLKMPFRFVAFVDHTEGLYRDIPVMEIWPEVSKALHPKRPNCYRRLNLFAKDMLGVLGEGYILNFDLDILLTGDITDLIRRPALGGVTFKAYRDRATNTPYNGGMWLLKTGAHPEVWTRFNPDKSPQITAREQRIGSDQAWIAHVLGPSFPTWDIDDGVYAYGRDILKGNGGVLPKDARAVMMYGPYDPATVPVKWVKEHWR
jgi:hypothetical protein